MLTYGGWGGCSFLIIWILSLVSLRTALGYMLLLSHSSDMTSSLILFVKFF